MAAPDADERRSRWPALMRESTARAYLDGLYSPLAFRAEVAPHLQARTLRGRLAYTKESIDAWIDGRTRSGDLATPADLARALQEDDNDPHSRSEGVRL